MSEPLLLEARGLQVGYGKVPILPPVDVAVARGEVWGLVGRNGAGKTTLLRTLLGLLPPVRGEVTRPKGGVIGYVPQRSELDLAVPARVIDLVKTGRDRGWSFLSPWAREQEAVQKAMRDTDVEGIAHEQFAELSEGQKQRVLLARALVCDPALLVLDEPTSAMDRHSEEAVFELLGKLKEQRGLAVLLISHDMERLFDVATHFVHVDKDLGIAVAGRAEEVARERAFIRQFAAACRPRTRSAVTASATTARGGQFAAALRPRASGASTAGATTARAGQAGAFVAVTSDEDEDEGDE